MAAVVLTVVFAGCDDSQPSQPQEPEQHQQHEEYYSPFVLDGHGELDFDTVSFTDVGINVEEGGPADRFVLEAIAESLAYELTDREQFEYEATVTYNEEMQDPDSHLYCDRDHLYVALWRGYKPDRWGYSLWSGCHEAQKFEWDEIPDELGDDADTVTWVEPLTESIVDSVVEAHEEECYVAKC